MRMLIEIYFTKVTQVNFPNTALTFHFVFTPYATNKLIKATNPIWHKYRKLQKTTEKSVYFPYIDSELGYFALNMTSGLRIKEFPLYGTDNYYKMVGKKSMQKIFFRVEISVREKSVVGDIHCTTIQNTYVTEMVCSNFTPISHCTHFQPQK